MDTRKGSCWSPSDWRDRSGRPGHPLKKKLYNISRTAIHTHTRMRRPMGLPETVRLERCRPASFQNSRLASGNFHIFQLVE